jgi:hypothetical protein
MSNKSDRRASEIPAIRILNYRDILSGNRRKTDLSDKQIDRILERIDNVLGKLPAAIEQAHRRIISEEKLTADEKILSLYDDNAAAIVRGKSGAEIEFGNELFIAERRNGFIVDWQLYKKGAVRLKAASQLLNASSDNICHAGNLMTKNLAPHGRFSLIIFICSLKWFQPPDDKKKKPPLKLLNNSKKCLSPTSGRTSCAFLQGFFNLSP